MPELHRVRVCNSGYHLVVISSLPEWLREDCTIYLAEGRGPSDSDHKGKTAYAQARLLKRLYLSERDMRLFAADCAEHVLDNWTKRYSSDDRVAKAIQAARDYANGVITKRQMQDAAAASSAASAAYSASAYAAASSAAYSAYASAAAYAAASSSAYSAAYAAASAAYAAAYAAASSSAARRNESSWQGTRLLTYLKDTKNG
jgi:hypothetical protein